MAGYSPRPKAVNRKKAEAGVFEAANIDTAGLDPEMKATLGQEAARRVGAAGVGVRTRNPIAAFWKRLMGGK